MPKSDLGISVLLTNIALTFSRFAPCFALISVIFCMQKQYRSLQMMGVTLWYVTQLPLLFLSLWS